MTQRIHPIVSYDHSKKLGRSVFEKMPKSPFSTLNPFYSGIKYFFEKRYLAQTMCAILQPSKNFGKSLEPFWRKGERCYATLTDRMSE